MHLALVTVPYSSAGYSTGEDRAPDALREAGLLEALRSGGNVVADFGDVAFSPPQPERDPVSSIIAPGTLAEMALSVRAAVGRAIAGNRLPIVVGGECPLLLGCLAAARNAYERVGLLFVDGHEDAWPPHASTTGEAADMELGLVLGKTRVSGLDDLAALLPLVRTEDAVLLGPRDRLEIDAAGIDSLAGTVTLLNDVEIQAGDAGMLGHAWAERLRTSAGSWWLHLDLDVLSSDALRAVRYPQPGGLSWAELERLAAGTLGVTGLAGVDLTIYNPTLDLGGAGAKSIIGFASTMAERLGRLPD